MSTRKSLEVYDERRRLGLYGRILFCQQTLIDISKSGFEYPFGIHIQGKSQASRTVDLFAVFLCGGSHVISYASSGQRSTLPRYNSYFSMKLLIAANSC